MKKFISLSLLVSAFLIANIANAQTNGSAKTAAQATTPDVSAQTSIGETGTAATERTEADVSARREPGAETRTVGVETTGETRTRTLTRAQIDALPGDVRSILVETCPGVITTDIASESLTTTPTETKLDITETETKTEERPFARGLTGFSREAGMTSRSEGSTTRTESAATETPEATESEATAATETSDTE